MSKAGESTGAVLLVAMLLAAASCGESSKNAQSEAKPLTQREVVVKVQPSVVSILAVPPGETREPFQGGRHVHGTGVVYDARRGLVLTSNHYLEAAGSIRVVINGDTQVRGRPVARAQCNDFALIALRPRPRGLVQIQFGDSAALRAGDSVTAVGYLHPPGAKKASLIQTRGTVSSAETRAEVHPMLPPFPSLVLHQAPLQPSMSGGPLVDDRGELVGLDVDIPGGDNAKSGPWDALPSNYIKQRIAELTPGRTHAFVGWEHEHMRCHHAQHELSDSVMNAHPANGQPMGGDARHHG